MSAKIDMLNYLTSFQEKTKNDRAAPFMTQLLSDFNANLHKMKEREVIQLLKVFAEAKDPWNPVLRRAFQETYQSLSEYATKVTLENADFVDTTFLLDFAALAKPSPGLNELIAAKTGSSA